MGRKTVAVKLKKSAEVMVKKSHPWIFDQSIVKMGSEPSTGDIAIIFDNKKNKLLAVGLFDTHSPIRIKVLSFQKPLKLDQSFFNLKISEAFSMREGQMPADTNGYRLIYGEADGLPGVICDVYNGVAVLKIYSLIWFSYIGMLCNAIEDQLNTAAIVLRLSRNAQKQKSEFKDGTVLRGELPDENIVFTEYGVKFKVNVLLGHKTGFFLDHRANRKKIGQLSKGKSVLDIFCYAGGFSIHALKGGADKVVSVDISKPALTLATENAKLNRHNSQHSTICGDAFDIMKNLTDQNQAFDVLVVDPPSFAKQKSELDKALVRYRELARLAKPLVHVNGSLLMASCSSRVSKEDFFQIIEEELCSDGFNIIEEHGHDFDHPVKDSFPEGNYLKGVYLKRVY